VLDSSDSHPNIAERVADMPGIIIVIRDRGGARKKKDKRRQQERSAKAFHPIIHGRLVLALSV
jgi:hypothetical protein